MSATSRSTATASRLLLGCSEGSTMRHLQPSLSREAGILAAGQQLL